MIKFSLLSRHLWVGILPFLVLVLMTPLRVEALPLALPGLVSAPAYEDPLFSRAQMIGSEPALLFGTEEKRSEKMKPFDKWLGVVNKMTKEQGDMPAFRAKFKDWVAYLDTLQGADMVTKIKSVNTFMNESKYIQDQTNWGESDYWASPGEFLSKFGDCEDFSIAKYMALKYLGFDPEKMRIVAVKDLNLKVGHAILAVYYQDWILILDNQIKVVAESKKILHYQPIYSINESYWWKHRAKEG